MVVKAKTQLEFVVMGQLDEQVSAVDVLLISDLLRQLHDVDYPLGDVRAEPFQHELSERASCDHAVPDVLRFVVADLAEVLLQALVVFVEQLHSVD